MAEKDSITNIIQQANAENTGWKGGVGKSKQEIPAKKLQGTSETDEELRREKGITDSVSITKKPSGKLLQIEGFPARDEICPKCGGTKHVFKQGRGWVRCSCFGPSQAMRILESSDVPPLIKQVSPGNFRMMTPKDAEFGKLIQQSFQEPLEGHAFIYSKNQTKMFGGALYCLGRMTQDVSIKSFAVGSLGPLTDLHMHGDPIQDVFSAGILLMEIGNEVLAPNKGNAKTLYDIMYHRWMYMLPTVLLSSVSKSNIGKTYAKEVEELINTACTEYRF